MAAFDLSSKLLPSPSNLPNQSRFCLLAFIHSDQDPFTAMEQNVDSLSLQERKVARKDLQVVGFTGTPPQ